MRLASSAPFLRRTHVRSTAVPLTHGRSTVVRLALAVLMVISLQVALAQVSVPTFGTRGGVPAEVVNTFMAVFREQVSRTTGIEVRNGELITAGIAGSLEPEFAVLIAELDNARYAISGEIAAAANIGGEPFAVNLIVVDSERGRSTDLITLPLDPTNPLPTAMDLAAAVAVFTNAAVDLPMGDAALFVSSEPADAQVFVDGISIGRTSQLDVAMLAPGRYRLEVRKEGFLPDTRMVVVRSKDTTFVHVVLTAISGGSIQVSSTPMATVFLDGVPSGTTPVALSALPGTHQVVVRRDGFEDETFEVLVRNYLVTRIEASLKPAISPLVYWAERREVLIYIDGEFYPGSYAPDLKPGLRNFELVGPQGTRTFLRAVPDSGVFELDLTTGELIRHSD